MAGEYDAILGAMSDEMGDDELGAAVRRQLAKRPGAIQAFARQQILPGVTRPALRRQYIGLGSVQFTVGGALTGNFSIDPQRLATIRKLVISTTRIGATASGNLTLASFFVGSNPQSVNGAGVPCPVDLFAPEVQANDVEFDQAAPGVNISGQIAISAAPTAVGDSVWVNIGAIVDTVG